MGTDRYSQDTRKQKKENLKLVKYYLDIRRTFENGFQPYYFFRKRIEYIIGNKSKKVVRSIFNHFRNLDIIQKVVIYKRCHYLYNPANISHEIVYKKMRRIIFK